MWYPPLRPACLPPSRRAALAAVPTTTWKYGIPCAGPAWLTPGAQSPLGAPPRSGPDEYTHDAVNFRAFSGPCAKGAALGFGVLLYQLL